MVTFNVEEDRIMIRAANIATRVVMILGLTGFVALSGCSPDELLDVTDPDIINPADVRSAEGAEALRIGALARLNQATSGGESLLLLGGLLADEYRSGDTFTQRNEIDQRSVQTSNANLNTAYRVLHRARVTALQAANALREFAPDAESWKLAQMLFQAGYAEVLLAESFCSGIPLSIVMEGVEELAPGSPTTEVFERAVAHFDSALATLGDDTGGEFDLVRYAAQVGKGRALLNLDLAQEAAAAVEGVPVDFELLQEHSATTRSNQIWALNNSAGRWVVNDGEGSVAGVGINFVGAADPRVPTCLGGSAACVAAGATAPQPFDAQIYPTLRRWVQLIWPVRESPVAIVTGIEASLIRAEAELHGSTPSAAIDTLNALRALVAGLDPLTDPGTAAGREDLVFRERAFWLFGTGHRLGDMRRLMRQYDRPEASVFPTGPYLKGGVYGPDVNFPVTQAEENNPRFTGCIDRDP
jgi:hypothetical protein